MSRPPQAGRVSGPPQAHAMLQWTIASDGYKLTLRHAQGEDQLMSVYDFTAMRLDGQVQSLADYRGQVLLIVNTASECGFTPQYAGLEALYDNLHEQGFTVLGFPCNQFGSQEPGDETAIGAFCQ